MIPRRRHGETPIEAFCSSCPRESYHVNRRGRWCCLTCGQANDPSQLLIVPSEEEAEDERRQKGGTERLGESTAFYTASSHDSPNASANGSSLRAAELEAHDRDPTLARFVFAAAELEFRNNVEQTWRVGEQALLVTIWPDSTLRYVLRIDSGWPARITRHASGKPPATLAIAEVYAIAVSRRLHLPRGPELGRWKRRALVDAGIIQPHPVELPQLPEDAPRCAKETWRAIADLLQIRFLVDPVTEPVPLSTPFLADWSGVPQSTLDRGKRWLEQHGLISRAGEAPFGRPKPCVLWRVLLTETPPRAPR